MLCLWKAPDLPRDSKLFVNFLGGKEPVDILSQGLLKLFFKNNIFPVSLLNLFPKRVVFLPETLVVNPDFAMKLLCPATCTNEQ
jgi:hypothetical protein